MAPEQCPGVETVERAIADRVGRPLDDPAFESFSARAVLEGRGDGFLLTLDVRVGDEVGHREVEAEDCESLGSVAALIIALALDPLTTTERSPVVAEPMRIDDSPTPPPSPTPVAPSSPELKAGVRVYGALGTRLLPRVNPGLGAAVSIAFPVVRVEVTGEYFFERTELVEDDPAYGGAYMLGIAGARLCPYWSRGQWEVPLCAGLFVGGMRARPIGLERATPQTSLWTGWRAGPAIVWRPRPPVGLWLELAGGATITRPAFLARGRDSPLFEAPVFHALGTLGVELQFP